MSPSETEPPMATRHATPGPNPICRTARTMTRRFGQRSGRCSAPSRHTAESSGYRGETCPRPSHPIPRLFLVHRSICVLDRRRQVLGSREPRGAQARLQLRHGPERLSHARDDLLRRRCGKDQEELVTPPTDTPGPGAGHSGAVSPPDAAAIRRPRRALRCRSPP